MIIYKVLLTSVVQCSAVHYRKVQLTVHGAGEGDKGLMGGWEGEAYFKDILGGKIALTWFSVEIST